GLVNCVNQADLEGIRDPLVRSGYALLELRSRQVLRRVRFPRQAGRDVPHPGATVAQLGCFPRLFLVGFGEYWRLARGSGLDGRAADARRWSVCPTGSGWLLRATRPLPRSRGWRVPSRQCAPPLPVGRWLQFPTPDGVRGPLSGRPTPYGYR